MSRPLRVLLLTHRLPYAPNRGDRLRAYHILRTLAGHAELSILSLVHDAEEASQVDRLAEWAPRTLVARVPRLLNRVRALGALVTASPLTHVLLDSPEFPVQVGRLLAATTPDVILAFCSSMARFALRSPLERLPLVIDMIDADSAKWLALSGLNPWPKRWIYRREARTLGEFEAIAMRRAFATVAVNAREVALLKQLAPQARIQVLENGVDLASFAPRDAPSREPVVVLCGVMDYEPNENGAVWLAREVWPLVRRALPLARLRIVGAFPTSRVRALDNLEQGVRVTGAVADVRPELWSAAVATAPLHTARGVQNKVLEAVAAGLPCVVTRAVHDGLPPEVLTACTLADTAEAFANALIRQLDCTPDARRAQASTAHVPSLSWEHRLAPLLPLLHEAAACRQAAS